MGEKMLLAAIGCSRLSGIFDIAVKHPFVVFGTMDEHVLAGFANCVADDTASTLPVYFYESG
jgi:hypothetical protein